ncbi:UNVERIFIED_CONTAM: hypothetical protein GTU68_065840 [Idotea baltica]|nr:hypothetical protein [Idotea baltica]
MFQYSSDYDSTHSDDAVGKRQNIYDLYDKGQSSNQGTSSGSESQKLRRNYECGMDEYRKYFASFNAFDRHKILINQYMLYYPGATSLLKRDTSKDKRDMDVIRENHQFLWAENAPIESWGKKIAKKYYDKLFKEYCICDLTRYKEGLIGMRWRVEKEVIDGKGQFGCCSKHCSVRENLRTWEMNFAYMEGGVKKNALIKLRLCHDCSYKLNFKKQRKEIKKMKASKLKRGGDDKREKRKKKRKMEDEEGEKEEEEEEEDKGKEEEEEQMNVWKEPAKIVDEKDREEEFEEYLEDLFL